MLLSISTQMVPSDVGTFDFAAAWQLPGGQLDAFTFPIIMGTRNAASNVRSMTGALAFTVSLASTLVEKPEL